MFPHLHPRCGLQSGFDLIERTIVGASFHEAE
jgi:hypothetical protein